MNLPEGCELTYTVYADAWYALPEHEPYVGVQASAKDGGAAWEFVFTEPRNLGCEAIRLGIFEDAFDAFVQVPELFIALAGQRPTTLTALRGLLDEIGARNVTELAVPRP